MIFIIGLHNIDDYIYNLIYNFVFEKKSLIELITLLM